MKKYTIKDNLGNKETVYADNLSHAITFADSSLNDSTYELYLGSNLDSDDWAQIRNTIKRYGLYVGEYRKGMQTITVHGDRKSIEKLLEYFGHHKGYSKEYNKIKDSIRDEASLATTINALVNDEKAAIDAYNVAIKNLEGSIDDTARQVLINIRDDERRHIENLYSILNGQVTEKNLEDSIHDAVKSPSAYVNTRLVKNMLPNDLMAEGLKNDYSFNDVLKNFDAISSQILDVVKDALDEAKRDIIDFKRNYINALIN